VRALDADDHRVSVFIGRHLADLDDGGLLVGVVISESTEVAPACQARGARAHRGDVERVLDPPHERLAERGAPPRDLIRIGPRYGIVPCVKAVGRLLDAQDVDVSRQRVVDRATKALGRQARPDLEVGHLPERVHARIGTAGAVELDRRLTGGLVNGAHQLALHRSGVLLDLPAAVARARILDQQLEARHARSV